MVNFVKPEEKAVRPGLKDVWNAFMLEGAEFAEGDIPVCPCTAVASPKAVISWPAAKALHKKKMAAGETDYRVDAFIHFYVDDCKFDGARTGIWQQPKKALEVMAHFAGIITPDYSTNQDFPEPLKVYATYRMRAFGYWAGKQGIAVANNVRWGTEETWGYCFAGIPKRSIVSVGTVGGSPRKLCDRDRFNAGFREMVRLLEPTVIVVVGSANYPCFEEARAAGIGVVAFESETALAFKKKAAHE